MGNIVNKPEIFATEPSVTITVDLEENKIENTMEPNNKNDKDKDKESVSEIIKSLENDGMKKVGDLNPIFSIENPESIMKQLVNIMEEGANKFEQQTGRKMTYAEMRMAYG